MTETQSISVQQSQATFRDLTNLKKEYDDLCARLNVDADTQKFAWILLERFYTTRPGQSLSQTENVKQWFVCALYIVATKTLPDFSSAATFVSLSQLLRETCIRLVDFFELLKQFINTLNLSPCLVKLEHLEKKYIVMKLLFEKYERLYEMLFKRDKPQPTKKRQKEPECEKIFAFGWKLFLVTRGKLLQNPPDIVESIHLLICCVDLLFIHMPPTERRVSVRDALEPLTTNKDEDSSNETPCLESSITLQYLCNLNHAIFEQVFHLYDHIFIPYVKTLCDNGILKYQPAKIPPDPLLTKSFYLGGLLDSHLDINLRTVDQEYEMMCYDSCDFDERLFLQYHPQLQTPTRPMVPQTPPPIGSGTKARSRLTDDLRNKIPPTPSLLQTPARQTLVAVSWLQKTLSRQSDTPNEVLLRLFKQCTHDPTQSIIARVTQVIRMIDFPNDKTQRQTLTIKLYYRILEAILLAEETRLKKEKGVSEVNFTVLLNNDKFHKSLLACCLEIVIVSHKIVEMTFPHSLHLLELQPFDFCKVIETVVKHEPTLPSVVIKHLVSIEERILESMAWEGDSPLFTALTAEQREAFLMRLQESGSPQKPSQSACLLFASPMKPKNAPPSTPMRPSNPSVELFFRKVAYLASLRIIKLCADLQDEGTIRITDRLERQMEYAFVYTLIQHTEIMQNRHIDQIIMCVLYAICKLNEISITFKAIVDKYHRQPQANSRVYKNIRLNERETGDIIQFYNTIFIPQLEYFLLRFRTVSTPEKVAIIGANNSSGGSVGNDDDDDSGNSATPSYLRVLSPFVFKQKSPQKLQNIMISPRRTPLLMGGDKNKFSNSISYQFGVSPAKDLEQINKSVNKDSVRRQLNFDKANTEEATKENERNLKRKQEEAELVASVFEGMQSQTVSKADETNRQPMKKQRK